ncbi:MAG: hypothetical protein V2G37_00050 [bacterium JZ-2024 1]
MKFLCEAGGRLIGVVVYCALLLAFPFAGEVWAQEGKKEPAKVSGYMFGDYYFVSKHHDEKIEGMNGFWFRRIYFTYDQKLEQGFAIRFRLEMNSPGDFITSDTLKPFVKDAYVQYTRTRHSVFLGISPTPTWENVETLLGYRPVEKTPVDLYKMGEARDFGLSFRGYLDEEKKTAYWLMWGNGSGTKAETDKGKALYASLSTWLTPEIYAEAYADFWNKPQNKDWQTFQGFLVYKAKDFRGGLLYTTQTRKNPGGKDTELNVTSFYADYSAAKNTKPFFRMDWVSDPVPGADKIAYLALSPDAKPTFYLFGLDYAPIKDVHIIPNVEMVKYSRPVSGATPQDDIFFRMTFYYVWK